MEIFLAVVALIFLIIGSLLLLSPQTIEKLTNLTNLAVFNIDDKIHIWRRPLGITLLTLSIFCWHIALSE